MGASQLKIVIEHSGFRTSHFKLIIALLWLYAAEMYVECSFDIVDKNIAEHMLFQILYTYCVSQSIIGAFTNVPITSDTYAHAAPYYH